MPQMINYLCNFSKNLWRVSPHSKYFGIIFNQTSEFIVSFHILGGYLRHKIYNFCTYCFRLSSVKEEYYYFRKCLNHAEEGFSESQSIHNLNRHQVPSRYRHVHLSLFFVYPTVPPFENLDLRDNNSKATKCIVNISYYCTQIKFVCFRI